MSLPASPLNPSNAMESVDIISQFLDQQYVESPNLPQFEGWIFNGFVGTPTSILGSRPATPSAEPTASPKFTIQDAESTDVLECFGLGMSDEKVIEDFLRHESLYTINCESGPKTSTGEPLSSEIHVPPQHLTPQDRILSQGPSRLCRSAEPRYHDLGPSQPPLRVPVLYTTPAPSINGVPQQPRIEEYSYYPGRKFKMHEILQMKNPVAYGGRRLSSSFMMRKIVPDEAVQDEDGPEDAALSSPDLLIIANQTDQRTNDEVGHPKKANVARSPPPSRRRVYAGQRLKSTSELGQHRKITLPKNVKVPEARSPRQVSRKRPVIREMRRGVDSTPALPLVAIISASSTSTVDDYVDTRKNARRRFSNWADDNTYTRPIRRDTFYPVSEEELNYARKVIKHAERDTRYRFEDGQQAREPPKGVKVAPRGAGRKAAGKARKEREPQWTEETADPSSTETSPEAGRRRHKRKETDSDSAEESGRRPKKKQLKKIRAQDQPERKNYMQTPTQPEQRKAVAKPRKKVTRAKKVIKERDDRDVVGNTA